MSYKKSLPILFIILCLSLCCATSIMAGGNEIKARMAARIPVLTSLKNSGVIGENNKGLLEFRRGKSQAKLVSEENADRLKVYAIIAKSQGVSPVLVGQRRATQIAKQGIKGQWFQKPDGKWFQK